MEKINNNKILFFFVQFISGAIIAIIVYLLVDLFICNVIDKREFIYSVDRHLVGPIMTGFFTAVFSVVFKVNSEKKIKSSSK